MSFVLRVEYNERLPHGTNPHLRIERFIICRRAGKERGFAHHDFLLNNLRDELRAYFFHAVPRKDAK